MLVAKVHVKGYPSLPKLLIFLITTGPVKGMTNIAKELLRAPWSIKGRQIWTQGLSSLVSPSTHFVPLRKRHLATVTEITQQGRSQSAPPLTRTISACSYRSHKTDHTYTREPKSPSEHSQRRPAQAQTSRWTELTQCSLRRTCTSAHRRARTRTSSRDSAPRRSNHSIRHSHSIIGPIGPLVCTLSTPIRTRSPGAAPRPPPPGTVPPPGAGGLAAARLTGGRRLRHRDATLQQHRWRLEVPAAAGAEAGAGGAARCAPRGRERLRDAARARSTATGASSLSPLDPARRRQVVHLPGAPGFPRRNGPGSCRVGVGRPSCRMGSRGEEGSSCGLNSLRTWGDLGGHWLSGSWGALQAAGAGNNPMTLNQWLAWAPTVCQTLC